MNENKQEGHLIHTVQESLPGEAGICWMERGNRQNILAKALKREGPVAGGGKSM